MPTGTDKLKLDVVELLLDGVMLVDARGRIAYVNPACERIFGYTPEEMIGHTMIELVLPEDRARTLEEAQKVMAGELRTGFENRYRRKDGRIVHIMWSARWCEKERMRIGVARDVTERKRAQAVQEAIYTISEAAHLSPSLDELFGEIHGTLASLVSVTDFTVGLCDPQDGQLALRYRSHGNRTGNVQASNVQASNAQGDASAHDTARDGQALELLRQAVRSAHSIMTPPHSQTASGNPASCLLAVPLQGRHELFGAMLLQSEPGSGYGDSDRELLHYVSTQIATAVERRRMVEALQHAASYDELTGLPNRRLFLDRMAVALARARRRGEVLALFYLDIDGFKAVNDSLGHAVGDKLLREVASRLTQLVRSEDTVARLGGDEFVVLLESLASPADAQRLADSLAVALCEPYMVDGHRLEATSSVGLATFPAHGDDVECLLNHADRAMYAVKRARTAGKSLPSL